MKGSANDGQNASPSTSAGIAGAGGGTLLTVVAASLPETNVLKPWLLYLAPSVAIALSAVWLWIQKSIANHFREREVQDLFDRARATLQTALDNPKTSPEHRQRLQQQMEELETLGVARIMARIQTIKILDTVDLEKAIETAPNQNSNTSISG